MCHFGLFIGMAVITADGGGNFGKITHPVGRNNGDSVFEYFGIIRHGAKNIAGFCVQRLHKRLIERVNTMIVKAGGYSSENGQVIWLSFPHLVVAGKLLAYIA